MRPRALLVAAGGLALLAAVAFVRGRAADEVLPPGSGVAQPAFAKPAPAPTSVVVPVEAEPDLRLVLITDLEGELEPCGCTPEQLGGIDRLAQIVVDARAKAGPTLVITAGNLFRPAAAKAAPPTSIQQSWSMDTLAEILKSLQVNAAGLGSADLALGHTRLAELSSKAALTWLGAGVNLERPIASEKPNAELMATTPAEPIVASRVLNAGRLKVGVVGLVEPAPGAGSRKGQRTNDVSQLGAREVKSLRTAGADFVIGLLHGSAGAAAQLAEGAAPELIVQTGPAAAGQASRELGSSILLRGGQKGEGVSVLELFLSKSGSGWRLRDAERGERCERDDKANCALAHVRAIGRDLPAMPIARAALDQLTRHIKAHNRVAYADVEPSPPAPGRPGYVGSRPCAACHTAEYVWWQTSKHGRAFASLEKRDKELDLDCVSCHVTGYGKPGGSTLTHVGALQNVGCESCHGPGSLHVLDARPSQKTLRREVPTELCLSCHDRSHSSGFEAAKYLATLKASGHG